MAKYVCMGAQLKCSFGNAPTPLTIIDPMRPMIDNKPMANIMDNKPMVNIAPFGMCQSLANPTVASATAAAMGALTPMPCVPALTAPWTPGGQEKVSMMPALMDNCKLMCMWGGCIEVQNPGQTSGVEGK